jgi:hypothetical protein
MEITAGYDSGDFGGDTNYGDPSGGYRPLHACSATPTDEALNTGGGGGGGGGGLVEPDIL